MIRIRPYTSLDADIILSWCRDGKLNICVHFILNRT